MKFANRTKISKLFIFIFAVISFNIWIQKYELKCDFLNHILKYLNVSWLLTFAIFILFYCYLRTIYSYWSKFGVTCSKPVFIFGHILKRFGITTHTLEFYEDLYYNYNGKNFCGFYEFLEPGVVVGDLELIKRVLIQDFDYFANRIVLPMAKVNKVANEMLSNTFGEEWRRIRTAITPVFTSSRMKQMYPLIQIQAVEFVKTLNKLGHDGKELEMRELCGRFSMDTIASCAFGIECESMASDRAMFATMASKIFVMNPKRILKLMILLTVPFLAHWIQCLGVDFVSEEFHFFNEVVTKTLRMREQNNIRRGDFLDLMKDTNKLSESTMVAQSVLFLLAGQNNISSALSFTLHLLANHPDVQDNLRTELKGATIDENISYEVLQKLPLLDGVVKECLRLYPVDPNLERICTKDYQIPGTKVFIRKHQTVVIPIWSIHHDPAYWPDHSSFKPERFINIANKDLRAYLPFGAGPRQCIGMRFVYVVVKVALHHILSKNMIEPSINTVHPPPLGPRCFLSLQPTNGLPLSIIPLDI